MAAIQIIAAGDFLQLPPVVEKRGRRPDNAPDPSCPATPFCFLAKSWHTCMDMQLELKQVFRQSDQFFVELLNQLRYGQLSTEGSTLLTSRLKSTRPKQNQPANNEDDEDDDDDNVNNDEGEVVATRLYSTRKNVEEENNARLSALKGSKHEFVATNKGKPGALNQCHAPDRLVLKKGAQVVLLKNIDQKNGLFNGSRGVVIDIVKSAKSPGAWAPMVQFANGVKRLIEREKWDIKVGEKVMGTRRQIPLALAWAMTIHKSQGMTLDKAEISIADCFEPGQAYVALSRLRSLDGLTLLTFDPAKIKAHPAVVAYYQGLAQPSTANTTATTEEEVRMKRKEPNESDFFAKEKKTRTDEDSFEDEMQNLKDVMNEMM